MRWLVLLAAVGCGHAAPPPPAPPSAQIACAAACDNLVALGCQTREICTGICLPVATENLGFAQCVAAAASCAAANGCPQ